MAYRVVLDSNVFNEHGFPELKQSKFYTLLKQRRMHAIYGDVFLQEVVHCYLVGRLRKPLLSDWLPFLFDSEGQFARSLFEIRREEIISGRGRKTRIFLNPSERKIVWGNLQGLKGDGSSADYVRTKEEKEQHERERHGYRELTFASRENFRNALDRKPHLKAVHPTFYEVLPTQIDSMAETLMPIMLDTRPVTTALDQWRRDKSRYPYMTNTFASHVYTQYLAMTDASAKVDPNAQADLDLMLHLGNADILVSNETGYLKRAFETLWQPLGKKLFTTNEFFNLIRSW